MTIHRRRQSSLTLILWLGVFIVSIAASPAVAQSPAVESADNPSTATTSTDEDHSWDRLNLERPSTLARVELASFQFVHGLAFGLQSCAIVDCNEPRVASAMPTLFSGAGLGGALLSTSDGITTGHARAINSGVLWGAWYALIGVGVIGQQSGTTTVMSMMAAQLAGIGAGHLIAGQYRPTGGDVRFINNAGAWSTIYYVVITEQLLNLDQSERTLGLGLLASSTIGAFAGGSWIADQPMSSSRVALISLSGVLGSFLGNSAAMMVVGENFSDIDDQVLGGIMLAGATAGLITGTYLTRDWDADEPAYQRASVSFSILPDLEGEGVTAGFRGHF